MTIGFGARSSFSFISFAEHSFLATALVTVPEYNKQHCANNISFIH